MNNILFASGERNKAIKQLMATWEKNTDLRKKALVLLQLNPRVRNKKRTSHFIP